VAVRRRHQHHAGRAAPRRAQAPLTAEQRWPPTWPRCTPPGACTPTTSATRWRSGFYQGWDLHPGQLPTRYAAVYASSSAAWPRRRSAPRELRRQGRPGHAGRRRVRRRGDRPGPPQLLPARHQLRRGAREDEALAAPASDARGDPRPLVREDPRRAPQIRTRMPAPPRRGPARPRRAPPPRSAVGPSHQSVAPPASAATLTTASTRARVAAVAPRCSSAASAGGPRGAVGLRGELGGAASGHQRVTGRGQRRDASGGERDRPGQPQQRLRGLRLPRRARQAGLPGRPAQGRPPAPRCARRSAPRPRTWSSRRTAPWGWAGPARPAGTSCRSGSHGRSRRRGGTPAPG
jgi:hypothetical protein